jgi:tetratricopeptide (TPR) repeat protein
VIGAVVLATIATAAAAAIVAARGHFTPRMSWSPAETSAAQAPKGRTGQGRAGQGRTGQGRTGHERMVAALAEIGRQAKIDNSFVGECGIGALREEAARLAQHGTPKEAFESQWKLGYEERRLGNNAAAVKAFETAWAIIKPAANRADYPQVPFQLGVAYMRLGESQNCVARHTSESCLVPIKGSGVHVDQTGSRNAIRIFTEILDGTPDDLASRWLLNIAYQTVGEYPDKVPARHLIPLATFDSDEELPRFRDVAPKLGLNTHSLAGGVIIDDFDGDGRLDIVESTMDPRGNMHYFANAGDGTFPDRTAEAGLTGILGALNMVQADYDNDGRLDILMLRGAWQGAQGRWPNSLLHNDGNGKFTDVTFDAGLAEVNYPTQTGAWGDYDLDGDLDLYIGNESTITPYPCQLFRNEGNGTFVDVADKAGVQNLRFAKAVAWGDYDGDRLPDIYVSNMNGSNRLYRNQGDGTFVDVAPALGVTGPKDSFPAWFWDFDNDGTLDIFVSGYWAAPGSGRTEAVVASMLGLPHAAEQSALYRGDGKGGFTNVAQEQGLHRIAMTMGSNFGDLDNDGWLDFYLGTGYPDYEGIIPNVMYRNRGGKGFADVTTAGGFGNLQKGHGVAFADLDADGDQDVFEQMGGAYPGDAFGDALYENPGFGNSWITVKLVGLRSNRSAIGARMKLVVEENGTSRSITRWVSSGGSFGASPLRQHVGLGKATVVKRLEVFWPVTGLTQVFEDVQAGRIVTIVEGKDDLTPLDLAPAPFAVH